LKSPPSVSAAFALALLLGAAQGGAASGVSGPLARRIVDYSYRQEYDSAGAMVGGLIAGEPESPAGLFWQATLIQLLIYDSGNIGLADSFQALCDRTTALCVSRLRRSHDDAAAHFYLGMVRLNRARFEGWQQNNGAAFKTMLGVSSELRAALALDSSLVDAWFGLGMVEYFRSQSSRYTLGLHLLGSTKQAYKMVRRTAGSDGAFRPAAEFSLAYMMKQDGNYPEAESACKVLLAEYPGNRSATRMLRDAYYKQGDYARAVKLAPVVDSLIRSSFPGNLYGRAENWVVSARSWFELGQRDSARACVDRIIGLGPHEADVPWLPTYLRQARELKAKLEP